MGTPLQVHDIRRKENKHIYASDIKSGKHSDPVWEVKWAKDDGTKDLNFYSVSSDGRVRHTHLHTHLHTRTHVCSSLVSMP